MPGCDGSTLLNSTANNTAEKAATPNLTLLGFDVIDDLKEKVEKARPGVVLLIFLLWLPEILFHSNIKEISGKCILVEEMASFHELLKSWAICLLLSPTSPSLNKILPKKTSTCLTLSYYQVDAIGVGLCNAFSNRLYNFTGKGDQDPSLNPTYAAFLKTKCKSLSDNTTFVAQWIPVALCVGRKSNPMCEPMDFLCGSLLHQPS
ncbi:hypothetical protein SLEP1_g23235 [Rubroshorea leprosula]|uniref:peroxidase n=1 Tax=Rubroshorea leprosula TaxID=152421 RepID=A0AAV5JKY0_9ROSI|nr:hypothetical protein SLEP1_g23235 [Rubroshorea leprosula]